MKTIIAAACAIGICCLTGADTNAQTAPKSEPTPKLDPREAGARYGQALGVALVCYGLRTTSAVDSLPAIYANEAQPAFREEAEKVLATWRKASSCKTAGGPNPCRLAHEWSCRDALIEIGPNGSKLPGLIEKKRD
jgi:hypothetical protein